MKLFIQKLYFLKYLIFIIFLLSSIFQLIVFAENSNSDIKISISLTQEEKEWLENHKTITIAGPKSFPPFHYYDENSIFKGISADYILAICNSLGIKIEILKNLPWPDVLKKAQNREIDLIACAAKTSDREAYLNFSSPYLSFPLVIVSRIDAPFIGGIDDLHGKKLASIENNSTVKWLERDGVDFNPFYVDSPLKGLEAVSFGKADARIENLAAATYLINKKGITNLKIAAPGNKINFSVLGFF